MRTAKSYRYGFNGMERDDDVRGNGNSCDFGARMYDPRVGGWLSLDPLAKKYPDLSPYVFVANNPLSFVDPSGADIIWVGDWSGKAKRAQIAMLKTQWGKAVYRQYKNSKTDDIYIANSKAQSSGAVTKYNANSDWADNWWFSWETPKLKYQKDWVIPSEKKWVDAFQGTEINNTDARIHLVLISKNTIENDPASTAGLINHEVIVHILVPWLLGKEKGDEEMEHKIVGGIKLGMVQKMHQVVYKMRLIRKLWR